jgi:hypothetical protein
MRSAGRGGILYSSWLGSEIRVDIGSDEVEEGGKVRAWLNLEKSAS